MTAGTQAAHVVAAWSRVHTTNIELLSADESGSVYFADQDGLGRLARDGRVQWAVSGGDTGLRLVPAGSNVVAIGSTGAVAVLDGASGRLLACDHVRDDDPIIGSATVTDGRLVALAHYTGSTTSVAVFDPDRSDGFRTIGHVAGQWTLLGISSDVALLGGRFARQGTTAGTATRIAVLDLPSRGGPVPPTSPAPSRRTADDPQPPADPDAYDEPSGAPRVRLALPGPLTDPPFTAARGEWLGAQPITVVGNHLVLQDVFAPYGADASSDAVTGGVAALGEHGTVLWRAAGAGRGQQVVTDDHALFGVVAERSQVRVVSVDKTDATPAATVRLPEAQPALRDVSAAALSAWITTGDHVFGVTDLGKHVDVRSREAGSLEGVAAAPTSTDVLIETLGPHDTTVSYVLGL